MDECGAMTLRNMMRLIAHDDVLPGHVELDMNFENIARAVLTMQRFDRDAALRKAAVQFLELGNALPNVGRERRRGLHVMENNVERCLLGHGSC